MNKSGDGHVRDAIQRLADRGRTIDPRQVRRKTIYLVCTLAGSLIGVAANLIIIKQGWVSAEPEKLLVAFLLYGTGVLSVVGGLGLLVLRLSAYSYRRLAECYPPREHAQ